MQANTFFSPINQHSPHCGHSLFAETHTLLKFHQLLLSITRKCNFLSLIFFIGQGYNNSCQKGRGGDKNIHLSRPGTKRAKHDIKSINVCPESLGEGGRGVNTSGPRIFLIIQHIEWEKTIFFLLQI